MNQPQQSSPVDGILIGEECQIDPSVILGYRTGRRLEHATLHLGPRARVRSGTVIYAGSSIGAGLETGHNVVIREQNVIGDDLNIWNSSTIDYGCVIGNGVKIHCNVYVAQFTTLEDEVFLAPGVQIANDPHPICGLCMRGPTIKRGARIGVNVTILPHVTIGEGVLVGAGSVVTRDIPAHALAYGNPARAVRDVGELPCPFDLVDRPYVDGLDVRAREIAQRREV